MKTSLAGIAFEQIQDNYWYGVLGEFRVVMMKDSGFVNATKMCNDGGQRFDNWSRLKSSTQLMAALVKQMALENTTADSTNSQLTLEGSGAQICAPPP